MDTVFLTDREHGRVLSKMLPADTSKRRECLRLDTVFLHPCDKLKLGVLDGEFDLVWWSGQLLKHPPDVYTYSRQVGTWRQPGAFSSGRC